MRPAATWECYHGNVLGCHTIAALNAFFPGYGRVEALCLEALTGAPFGIASRPEDPNRLIVPKLDPDLGIDSALALLGVSAETRWFLPSEGSRAMALLQDWLRESPVLLGPVDMGGLPYLPNAELFRGCDHYVAAMALDHDGLWLVDGEGAAAAVVSRATFLSAWAASGLIEGRGAFTLRRAVPRTMPEPGREALLGGLRQACRLVRESIDGPAALLALAERGDDILAWPAGRRGLEFLLPVRSQRNMAALALLDCLADLPECGPMMPFVEAIRIHLLEQMLAFGRCIDRLLSRRRNCLEDLREAASREASLATLFLRLETL